MDITRQYLDEVGAKHIVDTVKTLIKNIHPTVDLSDYATTKQLTDAIKAIDLSGYITKKQLSDALEGVTSGTGEKGEKGDKGDTGVGISSKLVNYELIITLTDGTVHNLGNVRGEQGAKGDKGVDGTNGKDGAKGADGVSPTISVTETTNGHTVAITDVNGTQSFNVLNGKDGKDGASGGSTDTPSPVEKGKSAISGDSSLQVGLANEWVGSFKTASGDAVSDVTGVWTISDCSFESDITKTVNGNNIVLQVDNNNDIDETFTLNFVDADNKYEPSSIVITVTEGY